jgi:FkbM family methyltransferase
MRCICLARLLNPPASWWISGQISGFTTLYLARRLGVKHIVAVEPDPVNPAILCRNLEQNRLSATLLEAAVGPFDGRARFRRERASNLGSLDPRGDVEVEVQSMQSVLDQLPDPDAETLLKLDIEGGEEQLFTGDLSWLGRFHWLMAEFHPAQADLDRITQLIDESGLRFRAGGSRGEPAPCWSRTSI